jgi:hypothetical protein
LETPTAVVLSIALLVLYRVFVLALRSKGDVRAGANIGGSSFFIEVKDRNGTPQQRTSGRHARARPRVTGPQSFAGTFSPAPTATREPITDNTFSSGSALIVPPTSVALNSEL